MPDFPEEPLDSPKGYFPVQPGQTLKDRQWTIIRKLGWGPRSSTWLAVQTKDGTEHYEAIKILTVAATQDPTGKNEREILLGLVKNIQGRVPDFVDYFYEQDAMGKRHLCLVFHTLGNSVEDIRLGNTYDGEYLPLHIVQKVVGDVSETLIRLAEQMVIHGAVTADNFLFWTVQSGVDIREVLAKSPKERATMIQGGDGTMYPSVRSQPLINGFTWDSSEEDIMRASVYLSNYAHASARRTTGAGTSNSPKTTLAPEVLQGGKVGPESDIWMLGCSIYHLLTGLPLFSDSYIASPVKIATETLGKLESLLVESDKVAEKDISATVSFLRSCLAIKPAKRASAEDIFNGSWVKKGCSCGYGW